MKRKLHLLLLAFILHLPAYAVKGLYVNIFASILGNTNKEDSLLNYASQNGFTYLALYELNIVQASHDLTTLATSQPLAAFISKAKTVYGIQEIGACSENFWWFNNIVRVYNSIHSNPDEKFDVYNLEFEFWTPSLIGPGDYYCTTYLNPGGFTCDTSGAFAFYMQELTSIDSIAGLDGVKSEIYIGWFNAGQALQLIAKADRILLHSYVNNVNNVYTYTKTRLRYLGSGTGITDVMPIFESQPNFLGTWLNSNPETSAYAVYTTGFASDTGAWKNNINLLGYQWFAYTYMPYILTTGIEELFNDSFQVYPNPFLSEIQIRNPAEENILLKVLNSTGQLVYAEKSSASLIHLDLKILSQNIYYLCIEKDGKTISKKIAKQ